MNKFNDKVWITKDGAISIARYLQICYLWVPPEDSGTDVEELEEIKSLVRTLSECLIALELDIDLWKKLNHVVNEELEGIFFKEYCDSNTYEGLKSKFEEFKVLNVKQYE